MVSLSYQMRDIYVPYLVLITNKIWWIPIHSVFFPFFRVEVYDTSKIFYTRNKGDPIIFPKFCYIKFRSVIYYMKQPH